MPAQNAFERFKADKAKFSCSGGSLANATNWRDSVLWTKTQNPAACPARLDQSGPDHATAGGLRAEDGGADCPRNGLPRGVPQGHHAETSAILVAVGPASRGSTVA